MDLGFFLNQDLEPEHKSFLAVKAYNSRTYDFRSTSFMCAYVKEVQDVKCTHSFGFFHSLILLW
jgi:hypothetical protein